MNDTIRNDLCVIFLEMEIKNIHKWPTLNHLKSKSQLKINFFDWDFFIKIKN